MGLPNDGKKFKEKKKKFFFEKKSLMVIAHDFHRFSSIFDEFFFSSKIVSKACGGMCEVSERHNRRAGRPGSLWGGWGGGLLTALAVVFAGGWGILNRSYLP